MKKMFARTLAALDEVFQYVHEFVKDNSISDTTAYAINLATEEVFTNFIKHNESAGNEISVTLRKYDNKVEISLADYDVEFFDISNVEKVDTSSSLHERTIGGLGLHLVRNIVDSIDYEYRNKCSRITMIKELDN